MNKVILIGRITKEPELKTVGNDNISNLRFTLAVNRRLKDKNGERQADFISCVAWRNQADFISKYVKKGHQISVVGEIQTGSYEKDGVTVYTTDVLVSEVSSLEPRQDNGTAPANQEEVTPNSFQAPTDAAVSDDDLPF